MTTRETYYCRATDAIVGSYVAEIAHFQTLAELDAAVLAHYENDPNTETDIQTAGPGVEDRRQAEHQARMAEMYPVRQYGPGEEVTF